MDINTILVGIGTAVITAAVPVLVAFLVSFGRRLVAAFETSRYAEAYSRLDPVVQAAIEAAASDALMRAVDAGTEFGRAQVRPHIAQRAAGAANALGKAAGVRVDLGVAHIDALVNVAVKETLVALDEIQKPGEVEPDGGPYARQGHVYGADGDYTAADKDFAADLTRRYDERR